MAKEGKRNHPPDTEIERDMIQNPLYFLATYSNNGKGGKGNHQSLMNKMLFNVITVITVNHHG